MPRQPNPTRVIRARRGASGRRRSSGPNHAGRVSAAPRSALGGPTESHPTHRRGHPPTREPPRPRGALISARRGVPLGSGCVPTSKRNRDDVPGTVLASRNASLSEMVALLQRQHDAKLDVVVPARDLRINGGDLHIGGSASPPS